MKNLLLFLGLVACFVLLLSSCVEGLKKQEVVDCYKAAEICESYWDAHGGDCWECKEKNRCEVAGLI